MSKSTIAESKFRLPGETKLGPPVLKVRDIDKMLRFYEEVFGLEANRSGDGIELHINNSPLLILKNDPNAKEVSHDSAGLYHYAIVLPDRKSLAQAYSTIEGKASFEGFADHGVSEALYLHDSERNGIEIYRDRPREEWNHDKEGHVVITTLPLDLNEVLSELPSEKSTKTFPFGARIGHMHLRVTNLERSVEFYHEKLGFDVTTDLSNFGAMFLSAGGYHHHIGLNTWHSLEGRPHETGERGLDEFTIEVPYQKLLVKKFESQLENALFTSKREIKILDPDGIPVKIKFT
ncbi:MAG: VOC family protein [Nitrososphaerales archaeon]